MTGRLWVVAPHATRTGSTRVLIDLLDAVVPSLAVDVAVDVGSGGPLAERLQAHGAPPAPGERPAAVLVNSALAAGTLADLAADVPVAVYLHETGEVLASLDPAVRAGLLRADRVLCVSPAVQADAEALGVAPEAIRLVPPLVAPRPAPAASDVAAARAEAGEVTDQPLVLGCGEASWRKGADLFVAVARAVAARPHLDHVRFAWVGRRLRPFSRVLDHDTAAAGLEGRLVWVGEVADPLPYLAGADLLAMTSRHDPQPLVPIEAAGVGTPTVGFAIGGLEDLAADGAAEVAPFPDVEALADQVERLLGDAARGARVAAAAVRRAEERQSPQAVVPVVRDLIEELLALERPGTGGAP